MAIIGVHALLYTTEPEAVRAIFRDVFRLSNVKDHGLFIVGSLGL